MVKTDKHFTCLLRQCLQLLKQGTSNNSWTWFWWAHAISLSKFDSFSFRSILVLYIISIDTTVLCIISIDTGMSIIWTACCTHFLPQRPLLRCALILLWIHGEYSWCRCKMEHSERNFKSRLAIPDTTYSTLLDSGCVHPTLQSLRLDISLESLMLVSENW